MMDENLTSFADWMRGERERRHMSQRELAAKSGISLSTVQGLEAHRANSISPRIKEKIVNALNDNNFVSNSGPLSREEIQRLGAWVKNKRVGLEKTQAQLAQELEIATGTISALETGTIASVSPKLSEKITAYLSSFDAGQGNYSTGEVNQLSYIENLDSLLVKIANVICAIDFRQRVEGVKKYLRCTDVEAVIAIIRSEIKK